MASIHKSGKTFHCSFRYGGSQFKPSLKTNSERDAKRRCARVEETIHLLETGRLKLPPHATRVETLRFIVSGGEMVEKPSIRESFSLQTITDEYLDTRTAAKEESTIQGEKIHIRHFHRLIGASTPFEKIDDNTMQRYAKKRMGEKGQRGRKLSASTVAKEFRTFNQIWKMAVKKGVVWGICPSKEVPLEKPDEAPPFMPWNEIEAAIARGNLTEVEQAEYWDRLFLDEGQVVKLVQHFDKHAVHPCIHTAVAMAAYTGARRSEVMRSLIEDWDFEQKVVQIREKKGSRKKKLSFRRVEMHPELERIAKSWVDAHPGGRHFIVVPPQHLPAGRKAVSPSPLLRDDAHTFFKEAISKSKWSVVKGWHVLRNSFCSNCARREVPDRIIDEWMGHRGDEAVKQRYRHLFPSDKRLFIRRLFSEDSQSQRDVPDAARNLAT